MYSRKAIRDAKQDDRAPKPHVNRRQLSWLLCLLIYTMVHVPQRELGDDKDEDDDADDLMRCIEFFTL